MANIAALRVSMGSNIVAARSSMELFINPADSGAMHMQQSARFSLLSSSSIIHPLFNDMPIGWIVGQQIQNRVSTQN